MITAHVYVLATILGIVILLIVNAVTITRLHRSREEAAEMWLDDEDLGDVLIEMERRERMAHYDVTIRYEGSITIPVTADSLEMAGRKAKERLQSHVHLNAMKKGCNKIEVSHVERT